MNSFSLTLCFVFGHWYQRAGCFVPVRLHIKNSVNPSPPTLD